MTAPTDGPKPNNIAHCLNALALMNMQNIASADIISDLVNDYFITRPIGNDSDMSESSNDECDPEIGLELVLDVEVNGYVKCLIFFNIKIPIRIG